MRQILLLLTIIISVMACKKEQTPVKNSPLPDTNLDGTITIQGRITVEETNLPPKGITSVNIKNKWKWKDDSIDPPFYGENEKVYADKNGFYSITINKGDTLVVIPNQNLYESYKKHIYTNLQHNQVLNIHIKEDKNKRNRIKKEKPIVYESLMKHVSEADPEDLITVSGIVYSKESNKPLKGINVSLGFLTNTNDVATYRLTDKNGQFTITSPKNNLISINGLYYPNSVFFYPAKDTVVNVYLNM